MQHVANLTDVRGRAGEAAIEVERLSHVYSGPDGGVPALESISLSVGTGRFVVIVGPSGCGKTSLLMMMAGLRHQTSGTIDIQGRPIDAPDPDRVGVVFQEASLFPWLSALDNIEFPLALRHAPREERRTRATEMLNLVGLQGFGARYPHELSGGMKQRVSIARGLVQDPPVLLMDEPFAALDEMTRFKLNNDTLALWQANPFTTLFVTHSVDRYTDSNTLWVTKTTVQRCASQRRRRSSLSLKRVISSSAAKGSSMSSTRGWVTSARAIDTRIFMPPESSRG